MPETVIYGKGNLLEAVPAEPWREEMRGVRRHMAGRLRFMTPEHQRVRYFAVSGLIKSAAPLEPEYIARALRVAPPAVDRILDELEKNLFFLVRDHRGRVTWVYPATAETTPHRLTFSTGERIFAAWAEDAVAAPFVEGQLRKKKLAVEIETECVHCRRALHVTLGSDLQWKLGERDAQPLVFSPSVDWSRFRKPVIIHDY